MANARKQIPNSIPERDRLIDHTVQTLRRASDSVKASGARRYFVPRGTRLRIDMNRVLSFVLDVLADGIEARAARKGP